MGSGNYVLNKVLSVQMFDENGNVIAEFNGIDGMPICKTIEKPIKIVYEDDIKIESTGDYEITVSRKATLSEIANWLGVDVQDVLDGKIGYFVLDEDKEN